MMHACKPYDMRRIAYRYRPSDPASTGWLACRVCRGLWKSVLVVSEAAAVLHAPGSAGFPQREADAVRMYAESVLAGGTVSEDAVIYAAWNSEATQ